MTIATDQLDQLAVDTIRTLSIDGVQQANSGHPGRADGHGADDLRAVDPAPPPRPDEPRLAEPRPLRPERRPRVDAPVLDAPPHGLRREPRGRRVVPPVGLDHARPPGVRPHARRRGDDRPARPGPRQRRGHGDRGAPPGGRVQPRRATSSSTTGRTSSARTATSRRASASEASSLAGHLKLGKLIALYDDNRIQLDGPTAWAFTEDVLGAVRGLRLARPAGRGRHRPRGDRRRASAQPRRTTARRSSPSGRSSATARRTRPDTQKAHGAPLGPDEVRLTKEAYGWDPDKTFYVPDEARDLFRRAIDEGKSRVAEWEAQLAAYAEAFPARGRRAQAPGRRARLPDGWDAGLPTWDDGTEVATRNASQDAIQVLAGAAARAVRRLGRPVGVEPDRRQGERPRPLRAGPCRAQPPVRRPRARDGRHRQRHRLPRRLPPLRRDVPDVQRLHAGRRPACAR